MTKTALLIMDYQNDILKIVEAKAPTLLKNAKAVLTAARRAQIPVVYVQVAFRPDYPEVSPNNKSFSGLRTAGRMLLGTDGVAIHPEVAPQNNEAVIVKHRVGAFFETDMATVLRAQGIEHLILMGISTSGVILSTTRHAADADFAITIVKDACADPDEEVHQTLMSKVFPRQAEIVTTQEILAQIGK
jgi:nicotinamidase-related amidase